MLLSLINSIFSQKNYLGNILADYHFVKYCADYTIKNLFHECKFTFICTPARTYLLQTLIDRIYLQSQVTPFYYYSLNKIAYEDRLG